MTTVLTLDSCEETVMWAPVTHGVVKAVHVMSPCTVAYLIGNRPIPTAEIVDAIFEAVSMMTPPKPQRVAF